MTRFNKFFQKTQDGSGGGQDFPVETFVPRSAISGSEGGRPAAVSGQSEPTEDAAVRLESKSYKVTQEKKRRFLVVGKKCKCRLCPACRKRLGWETRQVLLSKGNMFPKVAMITLTVDGKGTTTNQGFADGYAAHDHVTSNKFIPRLMQHLGIKVWVWVLEFQKNGWPHWHILADISSLENNRVDFSRAWHLWRDTWGIGGVDFRIRKKFKTPEHGICYITKYLMKPPKSDIPKWIHEKTRVRFLQGSKAIGRLVFKGKATPNRKGPPQKRRRSRTIAVRLVECGRQTNILEDGVDTETGEVKYHYFGSVPLSPKELLLQQYYLGGMVRFYGVAIPVEGKKPRIQVYMELDEGLNPSDAIRAIGEEIKKMGVMAFHLEDSQKLIERLT